MAAKEVTIDNRFLTQNNRFDLESGLRVIECQRGILLLHLDMLISWATTSRCRALGKQLDTQLQGVGLDENRIFQRINEPFDIKQPEVTDFKIKDEWNYDEFRELFDDDNNEGKNHWLIKGNFLELEKLPQ